jgi:hypothetical protein
MMNVSKKKIWENSFSFKNRWKLVLWNGLTFLIDKRQDLGHLSRPEMVKTCFCSPPIFCRSEKALHKQKLRLNLSKIYFLSTCIRNIQIRKNEQKKLGHPWSLLLFLNSWVEATYLGAAITCLYFSVLCVIYYQTLRNNGLVQCCPTH